jgi:hypothetical protein
MEGCAFSNRTIHSRIATVAIYNHLVHAVIDDGIQSKSFATVSQNLDLPL